ncbi:MAG: lipopolysaccharide biosynthesis protein [Promethearchaeota archaeon]
MESNKTSKQERFQIAVLLFLLVLIIPASITVLTNVVGITDRGADKNNQVRVAVLTSNSTAGYLKGFKTALTIDDSFNVTFFTPGNQCEFNLGGDSNNGQISFDVVYILDLNLEMNLTTSQMNDLRNAVENKNIGLFYQTNNDTDPYNTSLLSIIEPVLPLRPMMNGTFALELRKNATSSINTRLSGESDILIDKVGFISMPLLLRMTLSEANHSNSKVLVEASLGLTPNSPVFPLIAVLDENDDGPRVVELMASVRKGSNENLGNWPYFNYFIYVSTLKLAGFADESIRDFADWEYSPVPHGINQLWIILLLASFGIITLILYAYFRRYSRRVPLKFLPPPIKPDKPGKSHEKKRTPVKSLKERFFKKNASVDKGLPRGHEKKSGNEQTEADGAGEMTIIDVKMKSWRVPGYHKPLSGFFVMFFITLVIIAPLFVLIIYVLPTFILRDPASFGIQYIISSIFTAIFITLDFGLAQAYDRFVGQYWATRPEKALKYVQFFIWWQMISGFLQTSVISLIGVFLVPRINAIGFLSWFFVVNTLIQFPGIAYVFTHLLKSAQRTDLEALVNFLSLIFFQIGLMAVFPEIFRQIGASNPLIGEVIGASIGLSLGSYCAQMAQMLLSAAFLKKIDKRFTIKQMFRIDFDWELAKETLIFGFKSMLSNVIYLFGNFFSVIIITFNLNNYPYYGAFIGVAIYLTYPILFMTTLYENALPTTSEAFNNKKYKLTESFISYGFKYFGMFALLLFTLFVIPYSVNQIITSVVPELYRTMGIVVMYYSITRILIALGDYSKLFLIAIDRAGTYVIFVFIEQTIRITFLLLTIGPLQFWAFIFGEIPGAVVKVIGVWILTNRKIIKVKINTWQTLIAPGISCAIIAGLITVLSLVFYEPVLNAISTLGGATFFMVLFFFGFSNFLYPLLLGLLGGHDDETLKQMEFAAYRAGPSKPFAIMFYKITRFGSKLSPLHGRFPIKYDDAEKEAFELLQETTIHR